MSLEIGLAPTNWIVSCREVVLCIKRLRFYVWLQKNGCQEGSSCWGNKKLSLTDDINQRELVALSPEEWNQLPKHAMFRITEKKASTGSHGWERETWKFWLNNRLTHGYIWELNLWVKCTEHMGAYFPRRFPICMKDVLWMLIHRIPQKRWFTSHPYCFNLVRCIISRNYC